MVISEKEEIREKILSSKLFVFDFDGVIVDSVEVKTEAFAELYKPYGKGVVDKVVDHHRNHGGVSRFDKFKYYHKNYLNENIGNQYIDELSAKFSSLVVNKVIAADEISGVNQFLDYLHEHKKLCVINSATPENEVQEIIKKRGLEKYFLSTLGSPATKTENLTQLLKMYSCKAEEALFFGDAESDSDAANNLGVSFVGIGKSMVDILSGKYEYYYQTDDFVGVMNMETDLC